MSKTRVGSRNILDNLNPYLQIKLANLQHNYLYLKNLTTQNNTLAVVKNNAYGFGIAKISESLAKIVDGFAVATLSEALTLRQNNSKNKILIMMGFANIDELQIIAENDFQVAITTSWQADILLKAGFKNLQIFLKYDSGMSRLGLSEIEFMDYYQKLKPKVKSIKLMSHFCCADDSFDKSMQQCEKIQKLQNKLKIKSCSVANSAGTLNQFCPDFDNRVGIALYGVNPTDKDHNIKAVASLIAKIIEIKTIKKGASIGYDAEFICTKDTKIAVLKIGYGDGYPRNIKAKTPVRVGGKITHILGKVSMGMVVIDVSKIECQLFDEVEMFGENIPVKTIAKSADTIAYEIFCNFKGERKYL